MKRFQEFLHRKMRVTHADRAIEKARYCSKIFERERASPRPHRQLMENALIRTHQELTAAWHYYKTAGLSFLANRVDYLASRALACGDSANFRDLWEKFDRLNAGTIAVPEGDL